MIKIKHHNFEIKFSIFLHVFCVSLNIELLYSLIKIVSSVFFFSFFLLYVWGTGRRLAEKRIRTRICRMRCRPYQPAEWAHAGRPWNSAFHDRRCAIKSTDCRIQSVRRPTTMTKIYPATMIATVWRQRIWHDRRTWKRPICPNMDRCTRIMASRRALIWQCSRHRRERKHLRRTHLRHRR